MPGYPRRSALLQILCLALLFGQGGCGDSVKPKPAADTTAPSAVGNLTATATSSTQIRLTWTATGDDGSTGTATSYDVRRSSAPIDSANYSLALVVTQALRPKTSGQPETLVVTVPAPSTTYHFSLKAIDENGNRSGTSNNASGTTNASLDTQVPGAVTDLAISGSTTTEVSLVWTAPGDDGPIGQATSYDLRYSTSAINAGNFLSATQASGVPSPLTAGTVQNHTVTGLAPDTRYYFALKVLDEVPNTSVISNVPTVKTVPLSDTTPPAAVTDLVVVSTTSTAVRIRWTAPGEDLGGSSPCTSYDIRFSTSPITPGNFDTASLAGPLPTPSAPGSPDSTTQIGLSPGTTYYFALKVADEVPNWSLLSNVVSTTTPPALDTTRPATVGDLFLSQIGPTLATLSLTATGDDSLTGTATNYEFRRSLSPINEGNFASAALIGGTQAPGPPGDPDTLYAPGLTPGTTYYFAVKVLDGAGNRSAISNVVSGTTPNPPDTTPPGNVTTLAITGQTSTTMSLSWVASGDNNYSGTASAYDLRYSTSPITALNFDSATQTGGLPTPVVAGTTETFTVTGLSPATTYYFAIKVLDEVPNTSVISNVVSGATLP